MSEQNCATLAPRYEIRATYVARGQRVADGLTLVQAFDDLDAYEAAKRFLRRCDEAWPAGGAILVDSRAGEGPWNLWVVSVKSPTTAQPISQTAPGYPAHYCGGILRPTRGLVARYLYCTTCGESVPVSRFELEQAARAAAAEWEAPAPEVDVEAQREARRVTEWAEVLG
jgi:hypothetical protein